MKKIWLCILAGILLVSFSACGGNDLIVDAPDENGTVTDSSEDLSSNETEEPDVPENYALGTFEGTLFCSEWLGLNFQLPSGWKFVSEDLRKRFNDVALPAYKNGRSEDITYLEISSYEDDGTGGTKNQNTLQITVHFKADVETLEKYIEKDKENLEKMYASLESDGILASVVWEPLSDYTLTEQEYNLSKSTVSIQRNGVSEQYRTWDLWQEKDGGYIRIQCTGYEDSDILQHLSYLKKYGDSVSTGDSTDNSMDISTDGSPSGSADISTDSSTSISTDGSPSVLTDSSTDSSMSSSPVDSSGGTIGAPTDNPQNNDPCANGHDWVAITETVHHDEVGHYEQVMVKEREEWYKCPECSETFYSLAAYYSHFDSNHSDLYFLREEFTHGTNWEQYEEQWIVDKEAYDETVIVGYQCSVCGQQK